MKINHRFKYARKTIAFIAGASAFLLLSCAQADVVTDVEKIRSQASKMFRGVASAEIIKSPAKNVYRIAFETGGFAFAYVDGDFVLLGDLYNVEEQVNLSDKATSDVMVAAIDNVSTNNMIVYGPKDAKRHVTVFTDIDCGYCRKLHAEVPELTKAGIQVRYMAYPRAGIPSASYDKFQSVWCNADKNQALTDAKSGKHVPSSTCDNPISETFAIGKKVGVKGTPTIVLDNGTVTPGYVPANVLIERLGLSKS